MLTASRARSMLSAPSERHPRGQGDRTFKNVGPSIDKALAALRTRSRGSWGEAWATYGMPWAIMSSVRFLRFCGLPGCSLPTGLVVVQAPNGVAPERWKPVFM